MLCEPPSDRVVWCGRRRCAELEGDVKELKKRLQQQTQRAARAEDAATRAETALGILASEVRAHTRTAALLASQALAWAVCSSC